MNKMSFKLYKSRVGIFLSLLFLLVAVSFSTKHLLFPQGPGKNESPWKNLEDQIISENTACINLRKDLSTEQIPACSSTPGFQPLGSYNPVGGFVFKCGCQHASNITFKSFLVDFYKKSQVNFAHIPFTLVVDRNCVSSCYNDFIQEVGSDAKFNTIFIDGDARSNYFAQDAYIAGAINPSGAVGLVSRNENYGEGCPDLKHISYEKVTGQKQDSSNTSGHYSSIDDRGGNMLVFPERLLAVGDTLSAELSAYLEKEGNTLMRMEVNKLPARHVDEIFSIVRTSINTEAAPCDFVLIAANPANVLNFIDKKLHLLALEHEKMLQRNVKSLQGHFKKSLGCKKEIPVISFPMAWEPYDFNGQTLYQNKWPNPVNAQVIDQYMIIPDPKDAQLRKSITNSLKKFGISSDFMDSEGMEKLYGGIHCASKFLHVCRHQ